MATLMVALDGGGGALVVKFAETVCVVVILTMQLAVPEQLLPDQPENVDPASAVAFNVILLPVT